MSPRVSVFAKSGQRWRPNEGPNAFHLAESEIEEAADRIDLIARDIQIVNAVLERLDKNVTAAAKRAVKRTGHAPLRLNSRQAKGK